MAKGGVQQKRRSLSARVRRQKRTSLWSDLQDDVVIKLHHHKPYRLRHVGLLLLAIFLLAVFIFEIGIMLGQSIDGKAPIPVTQTNASGLTVVKSSFGYSFAADRNMLQIQATEQAPDGSVKDVQQGFGDNKALATVTLRPQQTVSESSVKTSQLVLQMQADDKNFRTYMASTGLDEQAALAAYFAPQTSSNFDIIQIATSEDVMNGVQVTKKTYQYNPAFSGGVSYGVVWSGIAAGKPFAIKLTGLVHNANIPTIYSSVFDTLALQSSNKVAGVSIVSSKAEAATATIDQKYFSDLLSPAVVKIYQVVCGSVTIKGQEILKSGCEVVTGSGFLVSSDGYIATNGHVVVNGPKDILVQALIASPDALVGYLQALGLSTGQIQQAAESPEILASLVAQIYDIPDSDVKLENELKVTMVALGDKPVVLDSYRTPQEFATSAETVSLKKAKVIDYDYSGKDSLTIIADPQKGFSASDVALLKIDIKNAPALAINASKVTQNQKILVMGFPGDAENELIDSSKLAVTVTNGNVSSIRDAAGGSSKLYQSDADASHGNSGGPAVAEDGGVFGLLTYRYASTEQGNAAKSYIRDIADFTKLASNKSVSFSTKSTTQEAWKEGLELYSQNHFSAAKKEFEYVKKQYPAHRLVTSYIASSSDAIKAGKDVRQTPVVAIIIGVIGSLALVGVAVVLIARHRAHHQLYRHGFGSGMVPPQAAQQPMVPGVSTTPVSQVQHTHHNDHSPYQT